MTVLGPTTVLGFTTEATAKWHEIGVRPKRPISPTLLLAAGLATPRPVA